MHKLSTSGQNSLPVVYELLFSFFNNLSTCLSTMNRTHLEGAAEKLTAQRGYTFYTGPEDDMGHTVRNYPAAWLAPPELHAVEGRTHGRATYDMTLHLLRPGARISPAERARHWPKWRHR